MDRFAWGLTITLPRYTNSRRNSIVMMLTLALTFDAALAAPAARASAPGDPSEYGIKDTHSYHPYQDAKWLYLKEHYRIRSGMTRGMHKGAKTHPYVAPYSTFDFMHGNTPPSSDILGYSPVKGLIEPSNGQYPNYGPGTADTDSAGNSYYDFDFWNLCGPGSADVALYYWALAPNYITSTNIDDTSYYNVNNQTHERTTWHSTDMRGYMTYLAWQDDWPADFDNTVETPWHDNPPQSWELSTGMTDYLHYPTKGVTLYGMTAALNWEASGRNNDPPGTWIGYFYTLAWISQNNSHTILNNDVVSDIASSNVPVVAEVDASYLPNWNPQGGEVHHLITIVGYDNTNGYYYYTDTCGKSTSCNSYGTNHDDDPGTGRPYQITQGAMWQAITAVTEDQGTGITQGDGGWVW